MTSAKGGETTATRTRRAQPQTATPSSPEDEQEENFSSFFSQKRTEAQLSQTKLGEASGISQSDISKLERGVSASDPDKVKRLLSELELLMRKKFKGLLIYTTNNSHKILNNRSYTC